MDTYKAGDVVPAHFNTGIVAASYFASLCGCLLTVELLHRRSTGLRSKRSWFETFACAVSMGLVGIWCMHFIGNRAIVLGNNQPEIQLVYSSGFTVLSLILPLMGLMCAFAIAEGVNKKPVWHWVTHACTGVFAGLSIVGMHYVANKGVTNYKLGYSTRFMAASFVIAIGDCLTVLVLFYSLREKWISSWWKRILCAMSLAGGVSAMHFTASTHCTYTLEKFNDAADVTARDSQVIIAGVMCGTAAFAVFCFLIYTHWRNRMFKSRSQQVTLACAIFDSAGRILVTTEGVLPSKKITTKYNHRTFDEEFDEAHPVFQWVFRVTHNWQGVGELIPKMKSHLSAQKGSSVMMVDSRPSSSQSSAIYSEDTYDDYAKLFKERFCTAASAMAKSMHWPIEKLGVLYDRIIETGILQQEDKGSKRNTLTGCRYRDAPDYEASIKTSLFGKGQVMFITREVNQIDASSLLESGFRFAHVQQVGRPMAQAMQIPLATLETHISGLKRYVKNLGPVDKQGTYLAFYALIPKPHHKGFDVVVKKDKLDQLPDVKLLNGAPEPWQMDILSKLDGDRLDMVLAKLDDRTGKYGIPMMHLRERRFVSTLLAAIITLTQPFPNEWKREAKFWFRQLVAHYSFGQSTPTLLFSFTVIGDMHASIDSSDVLTRTPKTFFEARHRCYTGSPDHAILAREIFQEFEPLFAKRHPRQNRLGKLSVSLTTNPLKSSKGVKAGSPRSSGSRGSSVKHSDDNSSMHELVDKPTHTSDSSSPPRNGNQWGGILVNSETTIQRDSANGFPNGGFAANTPMGMQSTVTARTAIGTAEPEVTFANELFQITKARFMPANRS